MERRDVRPLLAAGLRRVRELEARGDYSEALRLLSKVDPLLPLRGADSVPLRIQAAVARGRLLRLQAVHPAALRHLRRALAMARRAGHGPGEAVSLNELGILFKAVGRFAEAMQCYRRALRILDPRAPMVPTLYHNLGGLEHARERFAVAERFARRGLAIRARTCRGNDPDLAADRAALAPILDARGKFVEAARLYRLAIRAFRATHGPDHLELGYNLGNFAAHYHARNRDRESIPLYRRAVAIKEKVLGRFHPDVGLSLNNLAVSCARVGRRPEARRLLRRALAIYSRTLGRRHPRLVACRENLAIL